MLVRSLIRCAAPALFLTVALASCTNTTTWHPAGPKPSDPHVVGKPDPNFDRLIRPGDRIGPAKLDGLVSDAVEHLGEPDKLYRFAGHLHGFGQDLVRSIYEKDCIWFEWGDSGLNPKIYNVSVDCEKWSTADGLHVGSPIQSVIRQPGEVCTVSQPDGTILVAGKQGIQYFAASRNAAVSRISITKASTSWNGLCKD